MATALRSGVSKPLATRLGTMVPLGIGLAFGLLLGLAWQLLTPPSVTTEEYTVAVAAAYGRERLPLVAVERLAAAGLGDPAGTVVQVAKDFRRRNPDRIRDAANVEQLADVLKNQANKAGSNAGTDVPWALLLIVVAVAGPAIYYVRKSLRPRPQPKTAAWQSMPQVRDPELGDVDLLGGLRSLAGGEHRSAPVRQETGQTLEPAVGGASHSRSSTIAGSRRETTLRPFVCSYHAGDEPFEDVHPVLDDESNTLVGACGLTAAAKLETSVPARYYAFTAWVHDYLSGEPMRAVGLLSPWASGRKRIPLYDPTLTQAKLFRTEKGLRGQMETSNLVISVEVGDVGFGTARDVPANSYFTILSVKFDVKVKAQA